MLQNRKIMCACGKHICLSQQQIEKATKGLLELQKIKYEHELVKWKFQASKIDGYTEEIKRLKLRLEELKWKKRREL